MLCYVTLCYVTLCYVYTGYKTVKNYKILVDMELNLSELAHITHSVFGNFNITEGNDLMVTESEGSVRCTLTYLEKEGRLLVAVEREKTRRRKRGEGEEPPTQVTFP